MTMDAESSLRLTLGTLPYVFHVRQQRLSPKGHAANMGGFASMKPARSTTSDDLARRPLRLRPRE